MQLRRVVLIMMVGLGLIPTVAQGQRVDQILILRGATVIDGTGGSERPGAAIIIDGDRIRSVVDDRSLEVPAGAQVIDLSGKWIIPGLIDAHMHFLQSGGLFAQPWQNDLRKYVSYESETTRIKERIGFTLSRYVCAGVTSVMSLAGPRWDFEVRQLAAETLLAPQVAVAGPWVESYGDTDVPFWTPDDPGYAQISNRQEIRDLIDELAALDVDILKIGAERPHILSDFIDAAHARGIRVAVHATELNEAKAAVRAGADVLAHLVDGQLIDQEFIELLRDREVVSITTLGYQRARQRVLSGQTELLPIERRCGDPEVIRSWTMLDSLTNGDRPEPRQDVDAIESTAKQNVQRMYEAGLKLAVGSDGGNLGTLHGGSYHRELVLMAEAGMAPVDIIAAASRNGALAMARESEVGTIESRMLADLVVLDANPLANISNVQRVYAVVKRGQLITSQELNRTPF